MVISHQTKKKYKPLYYNKTILYIRLIFNYFFSICNFLFISILEHKINANIFAKKKKKQRTFTTRNEK